VILYRALERFRGINEARLYRVMKARIRSVNPAVLEEKVHVCISCLHVYTAEQRIYQGRKAANKLPRTVDPPLFGELTPAELSLKGKRDVGLTMRSHDPYCFAINLRNSPYEKDPLPFIEPRGRTELPPVNPLHPPETWADRLYHSQITRTMKTIDSDRSPFAQQWFDKKLPPIPPGTISYSQELVPGLYTEKPFGYEFLEKLRLRANRNLKLVQRPAVK
jgi:hypothetical protein